MTSCLQRVCFFVISIFLFSVPVNAAENSLSLSQALQMALTRHADLIIANQRVKEALARIGQDASPLLPQLRGVVSETRQTRDLRSTGMNLPGDPLVGPFNVYDARLRLTQALFDPGAIARLKSSQQGREVSLAEQRKVREDVLVLVAALFIEAKRSQDHFRVQQTALWRDKKEMSIVFSRFKSGISSSLDMSKMRAKYAQSLYDFEGAKKRALDSRLDFAAALDLSQEQNRDFVWGEEIFDAQVPQSFSSENQPDIRLASEQLKFDQHLRDANRWDFWPKISFSGEYGPSGISPNSRDSSQTYALGVTANIPIFEGGLRQANLKESQSALSISQTKFENTSRSVKAKLSSQYATLSQAKFLVEENEKNAAVAYKQLSLVHSQYQAGDASSLDLSSANVNWELAEDQKEEALAFELLAKIHLARLLGNTEQFLLGKK